MKRVLRMAMGLLPPVAVATAVLWTSAGCRPSSATAARLVITGSSTVAPLLLEIAQRFEATRPGMRVDVQTGGSARGLADVRQGLADIGMVSRGPAAGEDDLVWRPLAQDGVGLIVHRQNPVQSLSDEQVVSVFTGRYASWAAVGGEAAPITVVSKAEGRSTLEVFLQYFGLESGEIDADVIIGDNQHAIKTVAGNPDAVGYVSIGAAAFEAARGTPVKLLRAAGVEATVGNVQSGSFPIVRTLHLVSRPGAGEVIGEMLAFAASPAVHDLVEAHNFVPLVGGS